MEKAYMCMCYVGCLHIVYVFITLVDALVSLLP